MGCEWTSLWDDGEGSPDSITPGADPNGEPLRVMSSFGWNMGKSESQADGPNPTPTRVSSRMPNALIYDEVDFSGHGSDMGILRIAKGERIGAGLVYNQTDGHSESMRDIKHPAWNQI